MINRESVIAAIVAVMVSLSVSVVFQQLEKAELKKIDELDDKIVIMDKDLAILKERGKILLELRQLDQQQPPPPDTEGQGQQNRSLSIEKI